MRRPAAHPLAPDEEADERELVIEVACRHSACERRVDAEIPERFRVTLALGRDLRAQLRSVCCPCGSEADEHDVLEAVSDALLAVSAGSGRRRAAGRAPAPGRLDRRAVQELHARPAAAHEQPENAVVRQVAFEQALSVMDRVLASLPEETRDVHRRLFPRDGDPQSIADVARQLGLSRQAVRCHDFRARCAMSSELFWSVRDPMDVRIERSDARREALWAHLP